MQIDSLLLKTVSDLRGKTDSYDEYDTFMTAPLLRKLLLDGEALVDLVNRKYKLKLLFRVNDRKPLVMKGLTFWSIQDGFDPETARIANPLDVTKQEMLKIKVMVKQDKMYTVHELIDYLCHVGGAVHFNSPKARGDLLPLKEVEQQIIRSLKAINRVVLKGLSPLEGVIRTRLSQT